MARIEVKRVSAKAEKLSKRELYATICWYYPQYSLKDAQGLPARDLNLLLKTAQKQEALTFLNLTQISAAPHTKNGQGVKSLMSRYKKAMSGTPEDDSVQRNIEKAIQEAKKDIRT